MHFPANFFGGTQVAALPNIRDKKPKQVNLEIVINSKELMEIENSLVLEFLAEDLANGLPTCLLSS